MQVIYVGMFDSVFVRELGEHGTDVKRGEAVEVSDELGARLLEQPDNWQVAKGKPARNLEG